MAAFEVRRKESTNYALAAIEDYAERGAAQHEFWESMNGKQGGDPAKLAQALLTITELATAAPVHRRSRRARAGRGEARRTQQQIDAYRDLSSSLAFHEAEVTA